ncbi:MAG: hypothetical protein RR404_00590 [Bacilli bacterium]
MNFKYNITKENFKRMYNKELKNVNIFYIILASIIFFILLQDIIKYNFLFVFIIYILFITVLIFLIIFISQIYVNILIKLTNKKVSNNYGVFDVTINDTGITSKNLESKMKINWKEIKKINVTKNKISIIYGNKTKMVFTIYKTLLEKDNNYGKILEIISKYRKLEDIEI